MMQVKTILGNLVLSATVLVPFAYADTVDSDMDGGPTLAFQTIQGTLEHVDGNVYVVAEYITNYRGEEIKDKEMSVYVNNETKLLHGLKNIGDPVRIEVTSSGLANSIE